MTDFAMPVIREPDGRHLSEASDAASRMIEGGVPRSRMEAGLAFALAMGRGFGEYEVVEDRRVELAYARALGRNADLGAEAPELGSLDWARTLILDASIQREAEASLRLDVMDRAERHSWSSVVLLEEPWAKAGISPALFVESSEEDLKALAGGEFHLLSGGRAGMAERALVSGMAPGSEDLEVSLHAIAGTVPVGRGMEGFRTGAGIADSARFGPMDASRPTSADMGSVAMRMDLAERASRMGMRDAKGLFDPTPGRSPFAVSEADRAAGEAAVAVPGSSRLGRLAAAALMVEAGFGLPDDGRRRARMGSAAARLAKDGLFVSADPAEQVRTLVADVLVQRAAADALSGADGGASAVLSRMLGERGGAVGFTALASERRQTAAAAQGRFEDLDDRRGLASGVRDTLWRASIGGDVSIDRSVAGALTRAAAPQGVRVRAKGPAGSSQVPDYVLRRGGRGR